MTRILSASLLLTTALACTANSACAAEAEMPAIAVVPTAAAAAVPAAAPAKRVSEFDKLWAIPTLYKNDHADVLNELRLVGRLHLDNYVLDSDIGDKNDLVVRRARLGLRAKMFHSLDVHVQADLNLEGGPVYSKLTDAYVAWKFSDAATLTVGKHSTEFTLDGAVSSNRLLTIDRSNINNNFGIPEEYVPGISLGGKSGRWTYKAGLFSGGKNNGEFGNFKGGAVILLSAGYDFGHALGVKKAAVRVDYTYRKPDVDNNFVRPFEHVGSLNLTLEDTSWGVSAEALLAQGYLGQSNGYGLSVMPWINLSPKFQLVGRYTHMGSAKTNGLRFARYENVVTSGRGDRYDEIYAGVNYYIYGNNLKLQSGLSYANMRDRAKDGGAYDGVTWTTGFRLSW